MAYSDPSLLHTLTVTLADNAPCGETVAFPSLALLSLVSKGTAVCAWLSQMLPVVFGFSPLKPMQVFPSL